MNSKKISKNCSIDFSDVTPKIQIEKVKYPLMYKKAFLKNIKDYVSEYSQNTTTWE